MFSAQASNLARRRSLLIAVVGLLLTTTAAHRTQAGVLYAVSYNASEIFTIDLGTGAATLVGPTTLSDVGGIAFDETATLYATDQSSSDTDLYILDPVAGTATLVGSAGVGGGEGALVYDPVGGVFYSKANNTGTGIGGLGIELIVIDKLTGLGFVIGNMGLNPEADISGMALLPDGTLLGYDSQSALTDRLFSIDKVTGATTLNGPTSDGTLASIGGLAVDPDTGLLYLSNSASLFEVDPVTGTATLIGPHGEWVGGLSFKPDPSCLIGLDMDSNLYDVNIADGTGTDVRPTGTDFLGGLALSPGGTLYGLRGWPTGELFTLEITTGIATVVGPLGFGTREGGLDFDPISGTLYGTNGASAGVLYTIDTGTGAGNIVGTVLDEFGQAINVSALAFDSVGTLYVLKLTTVPEIYRINPANADVYDRVPIPGFPAGTFMGGMEFDDSTGILYASIDGQLVSLDPMTGATTVLGPTPAVSGLEVTGPCTATPPTYVIPTTGPFGVLLLIAALLCGGTVIRSCHTRLQSVQ